MDKTVFKALSLLEELSNSEHPRGVTELSVTMGLTKANVHRLLQTLVECGYVHQEPGQTGYSLTMKLWEMGSRSMRNLSITEVAHPVVRQLCANANESVQLSVLEGLMVVYVDKADSSHPVRATSQIGSRVPAHCVSSGKAILAFAPDRLAKLTYPLSRHTAETLVDKAEFEREMAKVRTNGYAINRGEWREGIWGIAAPIRDTTGKPVAAIDVWGLRERFQSGAEDRLAALVVAAASEISAKLGYRADSTTEIEV